jgi:hypothetical protein
VLSALFVSHFPSPLLALDNSSSDLISLQFSLKIIGDTIPHVIAFLLPFLRSIPVLSLLLNRSFVIILATVGVSYPLSLHRDISKLSKASGIGEHTTLLQILARAAVET